MRNLFLPQLADIVVAPTVSVGTGVRVSGRGEGANHGVGGVGAGSSSTGEGEDTADSEGRGTGARGCSTEAGALRGRVASSIEAARTHTGGVWEPDDVEN